MHEPPGRRPPPPRSSRLSWCCAPAATKLDCWSVCVCVCVCVCAYVSLIVRKESRSQHLTISVRSKYPNTIPTYTSIPSVRKDATAGNIGIAAVNFYPGDFDPVVGCDRVNSAAKLCGQEGKNENVGSAVASAKTRGKLPGALPVHRNPRSATRQSNRQR